MHQFFEGFYFKQQTALETIAVIPAIHADRNGCHTASIQVITDTGSDMVKYPADAFCVDRKHLKIRVGHNQFSRKGMRLNIEKKGLYVAGTLLFDTICSPRYDIMGPFAYVPFLECRHSVLSLRHNVNGILQVNDRKLRFQDAVGYIEGDRGRSFPKRYLWTQCNFGMHNSLMLSVAEIPLMGTQFIGIIGVVLLNGQEYRIATYCGAKIQSMQGGCVRVRQGTLSLTATLLTRKEQSLHAPVLGDMTRIIRESVACRVQYRLEQNGHVLLDVTCDRAGFEYEWKREDLHLAHPSLML
ncbi:MAG: tocopherol cyclase family protein [Oscillospiraceae bacterium]